MPENQNYETQQTQNQLVEVSMEDRNGEEFSPSWIANFSRKESRTSVYRALGWAMNNNITIILYPLNAEDLADMSEKRKK